MTIAQILVRLPAADLSGGELTHLQPSLVNPVRAAEQHAEYRETLARHAPVTILAAIEGQPDSVFVEDALLALPEAFVLLRSGAVSRRDEAEGLAPFLPRDRPILRIGAPATVDGGDLLWIGKHLFVGVTSRTNMAGVEALRALLSPFGYGVEPVVLADALHLKTAVTALTPDMLLVNPAWLPTHAFPGFSIIECDPQEPFAANSLTLGGIVHLAKTHERTAMRLRAAGFSVVAVDQSEFAKMEAGLTCMSVVIPQPV
jgi:dimethylargininase